SNVGLVLAIEDRVGDQARAVRYGENPDLLAPQRILEVPLQRGACARAEENGRTAAAQLVPERGKTIVEGVFLADFDRGLGQARLGYGVAHAQRGARRKAKRRGQLPAHRAQGAGGESAIAGDPERGAVPLAARDTASSSNGKESRRSCYRASDAGVQRRAVQRYAGATNSIRYPSASRQYTTFALPSLGSATRYSSLTCCKPAVPSAFFTCSRLFTRNV